MIQKRKLTVCLALFLLAGCGTDPLTRPGLWNPSGVNNHNIQAQLVNPSDYTHGRGVSLSNGNQAAIAVGRYNQDKVPDLKAEGEQEFKVGGGGATNSSGNISGGTSE